MKQAIPEPIPPAVHSILVQIEALTLLPSDARVIARAARKRVAVKAERVGQKSRRETR